MTRFGLDEDLMARIADVLATEPKVKKVLLFGSRARGNFKPHSDIDLALFAPGLTHEELLGLLSRLNDSPCVFTLDVVHFEALGNAALKEFILRD